MAVSAVKKEAAKPAAEAEAPAPPPKKRAFNWKLPVIALCVIGAAGGGAYWYSTQHHGDAAKEVKAEPAKPPVFLPLDQFTVNLQIEDNPQFLQIGITLKMSDVAAVESLKLHMPEVRDSVLMLLSNQKASNLLTLDGKRKLALAIANSINAIVAPGSTAPKARATPAADAAKPADEAEAKPAKDAESKPTAEADAKPAAEGDTKAAADADAKPADEGGAAATAALPVLSVLFTSFIVQ